MKKDVNQKVVNKIKVYLYVYDEISKNNIPSYISKKLKISRQNLNKYIKVLKEENLINKVGYAKWEINKNLSKLQVIEILKNLHRCKRLSLGARIKHPSTNLHALQLNFPILEGKIRDKDWQIKEKLNNWIPKYTDLDVLGGLTIKNNNNKSITVFAKTRDLENLEEVDILANKMRTYIYNFFLNKHNVKLDLIETKVKNMHLATEDKESESMQRKSDRFSLDLNKKSEKIFPKDDIDAKAWIDGSPYNFTAEANDKEWKREYLSMPFNIRDMKQLLLINHQAMDTLKGYQEQISLHLEVEKRQLLNQEKMNILLDQLNTNLVNPLTELKNKVKCFNDILLFKDLINKLTLEQKNDFENWMFKNL